MAKVVPPEAVIEALGSVKYPGFPTDILSLGIVEDVAPKPGGQGFTITIRQATENEAIVQKLAATRFIRRSVTASVSITSNSASVASRLNSARKPAACGFRARKYVIAVGSGKGGVGKSTVAANLAVALAHLGLSVGLMDADIYGPSVPMMFGTGDERPRAVDNQHFYPIKKHGVSLISIGFFLGEKAPVIWRGPMVMGAVRQFLKDTLWGTQDFLIVDLPPGTGDAQLTLAQQVPVDGAVIVTTPQDVALLDATPRGENVSPGALPDSRHRREHGMHSSVPIVASVKRSSAAAAPTRWRRKNRFQFCREFRSTPRFARAAIAASR